MAEAYKDTFRKDLSETMGKAMIRYNKSGDTLELVFPDMVITVTNRNLAINVANVGQFQFGSSFTLSASSITLNAPSITLNGNVTINGNLHVNGVVSHTGHA